MQFLLVIKWNGCSAVISAVQLSFLLLVAPGSPQEKVVAIPNLGKKTD